MLTSNIQTKYLKLQERVNRLLSKLDPHGHDTMNMAPRHREELKIFLEGHFSNSLSLFTKHADALAKETIEKNIGQLLSEELFQLDAAIRFIEVSFIRPRTEATEAQILEATDRLCTEMFIEGVKNHNIEQDKQPVGPIVALDSTRSPAIWSENTTLDIPSLFSNNLSYGAIIPVVCLPADISQSPEFYPLLSHEVGHALDSALGISSKIISTFDKTTQGKKYWHKWMREIVADFYGVYFSGTAFGLSFVHFISRYNLPDDLDQASKYPPISLRLQFIAATIRQLYASSEDLDFTLECVLRGIDLQLKPEDFEELNNAYINEIQPRLMLHIIPEISQEKLQLLESQIISYSQTQPKLEQTPELPFIRLPSILAHRCFRDSGMSNETIKIFRHWHSNALAPEWANQSSSWQFIEHLATLRPTFTLSGSKKKRPPIPLLTTHDEITFLGATNKSLAKLIQEAAKLRTTDGEILPWKRISIYFASDALLEQVIYEESDLPQKKQVRDEAIKILQGLFQENPEWCPAVSMHLFNGPAIFGSYWDSNEIGGRIHMSSQLLGKDIGVCPSQDHIWTTNPPSYEYENYREHLKAVENLSIKITKI